MSCDDLIEVVDISDRTVSVLAPTNETVLNTTSITFTWEAIEDAESYSLQIATPSFDEAIQIVVDTTLTSLNYMDVLDNGNYEWRIRAENSDYQTTYTTQSFSIEQ
jgi:hypothetical protein